MEHRHQFYVGAFVTLALLGLSGLAIAGEETVTPQQAGEKVGVVGTFVRVAENSEGWVVLGFGTANGSVKEEWMLLNVGLTLQQDAKSQHITRDRITLVTPDGQAVSLPSNEEYSKARASLANVTSRDDMMHESIDYFPAGANRPSPAVSGSSPIPPSRCRPWPTIKSISTHSVPASVASTSTSRAASSSATTISTSPSPTASSGCPSTS